MRIHVFVGPTLARAEVEQELPGAEIFAPVAFGDVYRAVKARAEAIAIIDGYFERTPAVWHKEILWAMSEGVHVFGASSMGALRAAELADFGMQGIGDVFNGFRSGELEDDDEVTVVHSAPEDGFRRHSEAMVNLRATFLAAASAGVISSRTAAALIDVAKQRFYAERSFEQTLRDAPATLPATELAAFKDWLPSGRVDQKASDARRMLKHLRSWREQSPKPLRVSYRLEPTDAWLEACRIADIRGTSPAARSENSELEEELKLTGAYPAARDAAIARAAARDEARRSGFRPDPPTVAQAAESLRRDLGLFDPADFKEWQRAQRLEQDSLAPFFEDQARVLWSQPQALGWAKDALVDQLRVDRKYGPLLERAEAKARCLAAFGPRGPSLHDSGMNEEELWRWFFEEALQEKLPQDLPRRALALGFADPDEMRAAALRELLFRRAGGRALTKQ